MKERMKVGIIIADDNEFAPLQTAVQAAGGSLFQIYSRPACSMELADGDRKIELIGILCGVGKVNAAAGTAYLADRKVDAIISTGLSGGIDRIGRGEVTLGTAFVEYDFDLSPLGYEVGVKPSGEETLHTADKLLCEHFQTIFPNIKPGAMATGDRFVCDDVLRRELATKYAAMSCDMETAAVAAVCHDTGIPFTAVRRVSDDAGSSADGDYTAAKGVLEDNLVEIVLTGVKALLKNDRFWG